jgi:HSP20 family molecular chaperone IbpA
MATLLPFGFLGAADPFRELRRLQNEMDRVLGTFPAPSQLATAGLFPAVNVYGGQDGIAVVAELPGVDKDDLEIQAHHDTLTLHGTRRPPSDRREAYHRREKAGWCFYPHHSASLPDRSRSHRSAPRERGVAAESGASRGG